MSISEIYQIASLAKEKLLTEAQHKDHNLVRIVHHAQLYDMLLEKYYEEEDRKGEEALKEEARGRKGFAAHVECNLQGIPEEPEEISNEHSDTESDTDSDSDFEDTASDLMAYHEETLKYSASYQCAVTEQYTAVSVVEVELGEEDD